MISREDKKDVSKAFGSSVANKVSHATNDARNRAIHAKMGKAKIPGWRTMTGAQRHNARLDRALNTAREIERKRVSEGHRPNPNLTDIN